MQSAGGLPGARSRGVYHATDNKCNPLRFPAFACLGCDAAPVAHAVHYEAAADIPRFGLLGPLALPRPLPPCPSLLRRAWCCTEGHTLLFLWRISKSVSINDMPEMAEQHVHFSDLMHHKPGKVHDGGSMRHHGIDQVGHSITWAQPAMPSAS